MITPRVVKGGLVEVDLDSGRPVTVIPLQYNPDSLTRSLEVHSPDGEDGRSRPVRLKRTAVETIDVEAELDATDALARPGENPDAVEVGLHPQLAALELLAHPSAEHLRTVDDLAGSGVLEVLAPQEPLVVFVWSRQRVLPVRITRLSITEEAFDVNLNPIRATVSLSLRVLSVDDVGFDHRAGSLFMGHLRSKEGLAERARSTALSALGVEVL